MLNDFYRFQLQPTFIPPSALLSDLRSLINNAELSDVTFLVECKEVHANRSVLAVRSEYFNALLVGSTMKESIQIQEDAAGGVSVQERRPIEIKEVSHPVFMKVLEFLYTDSIQSIEGISSDLGIQILISSELFMLDRLKALCEDTIRRDINVDNVVEILLASYRHGAAGLKDIALEFIIKHLRDPVITEGLSVRIGIDVIFTLDFVKPRVLISIHIIASAGFEV